ncbi:A1L transcription factor [Salmon gill poxvirus]|uniref:A1L transcription factor n=1 Tax=Salmon gill poxvirus TaxID=1680908 RepID=A0A0H4XWK0_9POXV|nr:A1L transcription factor [Salmon gill poxvirus]AKR04223.1 A1L transcription factor [Salmon gill poxvirus]
METDKLILPNHHDIIKYIHSDILEYNNDSKTCLTCGNDIGPLVYKLETLFEGKIGAFCSPACSDIMAGCVSHAISLKSPSRMKLPPLCMYKNSTRLVETVTKEMEKCYGTQQRVGNGMVRVLIKKLNLD